MKSLQNIVVGIDFSDDSQRALEEAGRVASAGGASLHVIRVAPADLIDTYHELYRIPTDEILEKMREELQQLVKQTIPEGTAVAQEVVIGNPSAEILRTTGDCSAELLVLGLRGATQEGHGAGMSATKCVHKSPVSVLLVHPEQATPIGSIAVGIDCSPNSGLALTKAIDLAGDLGLSVDVLYVHYPPWLSPWITDYRIDPTMKPDYKDEYRGLVEGRVKDFLEQTVGEGADRERINLHLIEHTNSAFGVLNYLEENKTDLVVLGAHGKSALHGILTGSTSEKVLHHTPCSLLIIRPGADKE